MSRVCACVHDTPAYQVYPHNIWQILEIHIYPLLKNFPDFFSEKFRGFFAGLQPPVHSTIARYFKITTYLLVGTNLT